MFVVADKYRVLAPVAEGGMGAVYSALHIATGRKVALKILHEERAADEKIRSRFMQEARIARSLLSPYITKVLDAGTDPMSKLPYIVMELLEGEDLGALIKRRGRLPIGLVLVIAAHIAAGLTEAHEAEIVHRDIKPSNVVLITNVDGELVTKIIDFGIARAQNNEEAVHTQTGDFMGSLPYMSPEQLGGERVDARTDIWSLGILMYEALSGDRPTGNESAVAAVVQRVCFEDIPPLTKVAPWVPPNVSAVVQRALRRSRDDRFSSIREMHDALHSLLADGTHHRGDVLNAGEDITVSSANPIEQESTAMMPNAPISPINVPIPPSMTAPPDSPTLMSPIADSQPQREPQAQPQPVAMMEPLDLMAGADVTLAPTIAQPYELAPVVAAPATQRPAQDSSSYARIMVIAAALTTLLAAMLIIVVRQRGPEGPVLSTTPTPVPVPVPAPIPVPVATPTETASVAASPAVTAPTPSPTPIPTPTPATPVAATPTTPVSKPSVGPRVTKPAQPSQPRKDPLGHM